MSTDNWLQIESAPRDGTLILLLIKPDEGISWNPLQDTTKLSPTIGHNNFDNDGEDVWQFAGWDWDQDCYEHGNGTAVKWMPFPKTPTD